MAEGRNGGGEGKPARVVKAAKQGDSMRGFYILIGVIAVAGVAALGYLTSRPKGGDPMRWDKLLPKMAAQGHVLGGDSAKLEVIEFGDFECGCGQFATVTEPDVREHFVKPGIVRMRFIDYPLPMHANTRHASHAAWCAGDQGKFWEMHDAIYQHQDLWNTEVTDNPDKVLAGIAQNVGLNLEQYSSCMTSHKYLAQLQANFDEAVARKAPGTPTFVFGSKMIWAPLTYDQFRAYVDSALAAQGTTIKK